MGTCWYSYGLWFALLQAMQVDYARGPMSNNKMIRARLGRAQDLRLVKSRHALRMALLRLLESRPLDQITIKEITTEAGVSYPVFFRQFASKEDLLADLATDQVRALLQHTYPTLNADAPSANLVNLCQYVAEHRGLWRSLLTTGAAPAMRVEFARIAAEIGNTAPRTNPWLPVELASAFVASGIFEILAWWLSQSDDYPVVNVVKLLDVLIVRSMVVPQDIRLD